MKKSIKLLFLTNIATLIVLAVVSLHYKVPQKALVKLGIMDSKLVNVKYDKYAIQNALFAEYSNKECKVVMLGNSITEGVAWNELLGIPCIANRGIGGDITDGFYKRLSDIYKLKPELCFIMGGINDIHRDIPVKTILENMEKIVDGLQENGITPVIQSTLFISRECLNWKKVNKSVEELNTGLRNICIRQNILFVDVNKILSTNGTLNDEYTYDGVHLYGAGYREWGKLIMSIMDDLLVQHIGN
jgi:lysophospholipase L1-like esterase